MRPLETIQHFDRFLAMRNLRFSAGVIGGAAREFAAEIDLGETSLKKLWLNSGVRSMHRYLRPGWQGRIQPLFIGDAINFQTLGRIDLIATKVLAYCDRGQDLDDCLRLKPSKEELTEILPWIRAHDGNPGWAEYVQSQVEDLARRLGYGL